MRGRSCVGSNKNVIFIHPKKIVFFSSGQRVSLFITPVLKLQDHKQVMPATRQRSKKQKAVIHRVSTQLRKERSRKQETAIRDIHIRKLQTRGDCLLPSLQGLLNLDRRASTTNLKESSSDRIYIDSKHFRKLEDWILEKAADGAEDGGYAIELLKLIGKETDQAISMYRNKAATGWANYWNVQEDMKEIKKKTKEVQEEMERLERLHRSNLDNMRARYAFQKMGI
jgi:hypothetical protein